LAIDGRIHVVISESRALAPETVSRKGPQLWSREPRIGPPAELEDLSVNAIRVLSMDAVERAGSGHPGTPMGLAPLGYVLFTRFLSHNPAHPEWPDRDRFVLSAGHASMLLYSLLHLSGYDLSLEDITRFRQWGSRTPGHPEVGHTPGVETSTGPLGQGFANAVGMALAERLGAQRFNRRGHEVVNHRTWVISSDGDMMEGISSEAASLAGSLQLGKLVCFYDDNRITIEGDTGLSFRESVARRFKAYGWQVLHISDGNDLDEIARITATALDEETRPSLIVVRTHIGYGSPGKQDSAAAHGAPLGGEEVRATRRALGWPHDEEFVVPEAVVAHFRKQIESGHDREKKWRARFERWAEAEPGLAREWKSLQEGRLSGEWTDVLPSFDPSDGPMATRTASGNVLNAIAKRLPALVGGSADLAPSTETYLEGYGDVSGQWSDDDPAGPNDAPRNLHFGVREHAMGAILNGMALHGGLLPYGGTFLVFSDYMRPAIRMAALMGLPVVYVFTHDSIGLGEDGPTHQPVEQLSSLRLIPNLVVLRPADANETAEAWRIALERRQGPTALVLSRQKLPITVSRDAVAVERGAYALVAHERSDVVLIGTGSEVGLCLAARDTLDAEGIHASVVSMPSWELFEAQPDFYRDSVLPPGVPRLAVEAGTPLAWSRYADDAIGIDSFGASAPAPVLMEKFGFTVDNVVARARSLVGGRR
jgi:transketolase